MKNQMIILLFHVNIFKQGSIRELCREQGIAVSVVSDSDLDKTIGVLAGMKNLKGAAGTGKTVPFDDEMMVFCGMNDPGQLDRFLEEYRKREIQPIALKAVITPYNMRWTPGRLCAELKKEQQALS